MFFVRIKINNQYEITTKLNTMPQTNKKNEKYKYYSLLVSIKYLQIKNSCLVLECWRGFEERLQAEI